MRPSENELSQELLSNRQRLPPLVVWTGIWLGTFLILPLIFEIADASHLLPHKTVPAPRVNLALLALSPALMASLVTFSIWQGSQRQQGYQPTSSPPVSPAKSTFRMIGLLALLIGLRLIPILLFTHHALHPDWVKLGLCTAALCGVLFFLNWWGDAYLPQSQLPVDPLSPKASAAFAAVPSSANAMSSQNSKGLYLVKDTDQELIFRLPWWSRGCLFLLIAFLGIGPFICIRGYFIGSIAHTGQMLGAMLVSCSAFGFLALVLLSVSGPNTLSVDLETRTYSHIRYAPLSIKKYAKLGFGIPFRVQSVTGPMSDIAGICINEVSGRTTIYWMYLVWQDTFRPRASLGRFYQAEEAQAQMMAVAARMGVPALGRCID